MTFEKFSFSVSVFSIAIRPKKVIYRMAEIEKSVLVGYSATQMFNLVDTVENYPDFLPWCSGASMELQDDDSAHATVNINYHHIKHSFTTKNIRRPPELIEMELVEGPFEHLDGRWHFIPLSEIVLLCQIQIIPMRHPVDV
jgi:ribosome-associated toxin RatA of RatAB toxin-antitoxin module